MQKHIASHRNSTLTDPGLKRLIQAYHNDPNAAVVEDFKFRPGFIYTSVRAISARINQNYDAWPSGELRKSYRTFLGKPCFVNHQNFDPTKARGRVVAARYVESGNDKFIEVIQEVDAQRFPKLAHEIRTGGMDSVSMGVEAGFTKCSICDNKATDLHDMCAHVKHSKGKYLPHAKTGKRTLVYENCHKLSFFELSYVFDPADETAVVSKVLVANRRNADFDSGWTPNDSLRGEDPEEVDEEVPDEPGGFTNGWESYKGRRLDPRSEVYTHLNLHAVNQGLPGIWSFSQAQHVPDNSGKLRKKNLVVGYAPEAHLSNARMHVQKGAASKYHEAMQAHLADPENVPAPSRTVHAGIKGHLAHPPREALPYSGIEYHPGDVYGEFVHRDDKEPVHTADTVHLSRDKRAYAHQADNWGRDHEPQLVVDPDPSVNASNRHTVWPRQSRQALRREAAINAKYFSGPARYAYKAGDPEFRGSAADFQKGDRVQHLSPSFHGRGVVHDLHPERGVGVTWETEMGGPHQTWEHPGDLRKQGRYKHAGDGMSYKDTMKYAYGEVTAPPDVDTLRNADDADDDHFHHYVESPKELRTPDLENAGNLRRNKGGPSDVSDFDPEGDSTKDFVESDTSHEEAIDDFLDWCDSINVTPSDDSLNDFANSYHLDDEDYQAISDFLAAEQGNGAGPTNANQPVPRTSRRKRMATYRYAEEESAPDQEAYGEDDPGVRYDGDVDEDYDDGGGDQGGDDPEELIQAFVDWCGQNGAPPSQEALDAFDQEAQLSDEEYQLLSEIVAEVTGGGGEDEHGGLPAEPEGGDEYGGPGAGGEEFSADPQQFQASNGNRNTSSQNERRARKGKSMARQTLASRGQDVASRQRLHRFADDNGHFDSGPYGEDNQGEQEEIFLSQTPGTEAVAAPVPGDGTISNTEKNLVARINAAKNSLQRDIQSWNQIQAYKYAAEGGIPDADKVDPALSGTDDQDLKGHDFERVQPEKVETQPKDASLKAFAAFDNWLHSTTGRTASQHGNANFIRRQAARWAGSYGYPVEVLFPALGNFLRQARRIEGSTNMRRTADEKLEVAAPQDRIDVEEPVKNTTDADAQASQFDLHDFGNNAGDGVADPDLSTDSQIWAPGEGVKESNRKADGVAAIRLAEAYIKAGLKPEGEKYNLVAQFQTMRHATVTDRTRLLEAVLKTAAFSRRVTAGTSRGTAPRSPFPPGLMNGGGMSRSASVSRVAANDPSTDSDLFL